MVELSLGVLAGGEEAVTTLSWLDYASFVVAALSLLVSVALGLRNRSTAKRALEISEREEARREARLGLYLNESMSWRHSKDAYRLLGFHLLITNPTDRPTSIVSAELHLTYSVNGVVTTVKVQHEPCIILPGGGKAGVIEVSARLEANAAISDWLLFKVADGLTKDRPVDRYDVVIRDINGIVQSVQVTIFLEVPVD